MNKIPASWNSLPALVLLPQPLWPGWQLESAEPVFSYSSPSGTLLELNIGHIQKYQYSKAYA
jgi:hypothetical protein